MAIPPEELWHALGKNVTATETSLKNLSTAAIQTGISFEMASDQLRRTAAMLLADNERFKGINYGAIPTLNVKIDPKTDRVMLPGDMSADELEAELKTNPNYGMF